MGFSYISKLFRLLTRGGGRKKKQNTRIRNLTKHVKFAQYEVNYREKVIDSNIPGVGNDAEDSLIVSLTSFGPRIDTVYLVIESLMQQSFKADKIVLCLAQNEFNEQNLPATLKRQRSRGLEILFCEEDIRSYKKFFYTMQKYPDDLIITVDDDLIYPVDTIDVLYRAYLEAPDVIHCNRGHQMLTNSQGQLYPYKQWHWNNSSDEASLNIFPTGVGGVLYFPGSLDESVFDKKTFLKLAPNADDVWLKAMSLKNSVKCQQTKSSPSFLEKAIAIPHNQGIPLKQKNKSKVTGNDSAISQVFSHCGLQELIEGLIERK